MLKTNHEKLYEVIKAFYTITQIKIAVYDLNFEEIAAYPREQRGLCALMTTYEEAENCCRTTTSQLFARCRDAGGGTVSHKCHAGLTEVAAPLLDNGQAIGYVIFGQITDDPDKRHFAGDVILRCQPYGFPEEQLRQLANEIRFVSTEQIKALSFVLSMITSYIVANHLAYASDQPLAHRIMDEIHSNPAADLSVNALCRRFGISRSMLYQIMAPFMPDGIAEYVKKLRLEKAEKLLRDTDLAVWQIAEMIGFRNYEYFLRCFKKYTGISAGQFRKKEIT